MSLAIGSYIGIGRKGGGFNWRKYWQEQYFSDTVFDTNIVLPENDTIIQASQTTDIYSLYDALTSANSSYITKSLAYIDENGSDVYQYDFNPGGVILGKYIIITGVHMEKTSVWTLYEVMNNICNNWGENDTLALLRYNIHFIIIPVACPYAYDVGGSYNKNGVNIAENFPTNWVLNLPDSGAAALSESESIGLNTLLSNNLDAIGVIDFHTFGGNSSNMFFLNYYTGFISKYINEAHIQRVDTKWRIDYAFLNPDQDYRIGSKSANITASLIAEAYTQGIDGSILLDICEKIYLDDAVNKNTSNVLTMAYEAFVNYLSLSIYNLVGSASVPATNWLGKWDFNGDVNDTSGHNYNWTNNNAVLAINRFAVANKAYAFNGINAVLNQTKINASNLFTVCFWIKATAWTNHNFLFGQELGGYAFGYGITWYNNNIRFWISSWNNTPLDSPLIDTANWHFIYAKYDKAVHRMYLAVDMGEEFDGIKNYDIDGDANLALAQNRIGESSTVNYFNGSIDQVYFFDRILNRNELKAIYALTT